MTAASNGSATNTTVVAALSHQSQYCGPYKIEKTLGKGQTGMLFLFSIRFNLFKLTQLYPATNNLRENVVHL